MFYLIFLHLIFYILNYRTFIKISLYSERLFSGLILKKSLLSSKGASWFLWCLYSYIQNFLPGVQTIQSLLYLESGEFDNFIHYWNRWERESAEQENPVSP